VAVSDSIVAHDNARSEFFSSLLEKNRPIFILSAHQAMGKLGRREAAHFAEGHVLGSSWIGGLPSVVN
jgi:hypothetical protein